MTRGIESTKGFATIFVKLLYFCWTKQIISPMIGGNDQQRNCNLQLLTLIAEHMNSMPKYRKGDKPIAK